MALAVLGLAGLLEHPREVMGGHWARQTWDPGVILIWPRLLLSPGSKSHFKLF